MSRPPLPKKMPTDHHLLQRRPLINLITRGETRPETDSFSYLLKLAQAAVEAEVDLFQIREKALSARSLYALTSSIAKLTRGSGTRLLVNDRADIAVAAGADGVHLSTTSIRAEVIRRVFGDRLLIGVSTHSEAEVFAARAAGADFVVFGPVFETPGKVTYGKPQGLTKLENVTSALGKFPVLALGGITIKRVADCTRAGASGIAAIRLLSELSELRRVVAEIRNQPRNHTT